MMRVIQDRLSGRFYSTPTRWVACIDEASEFASTSEALHEAERVHLAKDAFGIVMRPSRDCRYDFFVSL